MCREKQLNAKTRPNSIELNFARRSIMSVLRTKYPNLCIVSTFAVICSLFRTFL